jgi:DNA topoisomerase IB
MVNDYTSLDQEHLIKLISKKKNFENKKIIVIHNFKDVKTMKELKEVWKKQLLDTFMNLNESLFTKSQIFEKDMNKIKFEYLCTNETLHFQIGNHEYLKDHNNAVFQYIKEYINI